MLRVVTILWHSQTMVFCLKWFVCSSIWQLVKMQLRDPGDEIGSSLWVDWWLINCCLVLGESWCWVNGWYDNETCRAGCLVMHTAVYTCRLFMLKIDDAIGQDAHGLCISSSGISSIKPSDCPCRARFHQQHHWGALVFQELVKETLMIAVCRRDNKHGRNTRSRISERNTMKYSLLMY